MASFTIDTTNTTSQTLSSSDAGIVTQSGSLVTGPQAVTMSGTSNSLIVAGLVYTATASHAVRVTNTGTADIVVTSTGTIASRGYGITANAQALNVLNNGEITAIDSAINVGTSNDSSTFDLYNNGIISGGTHGILFGSVTNDFDFVNTGVITGGSHGIYAAYGAFDLVNSGEISGGTMAILGYTRTDFIRNSGTIDGDINLAGGADVIDNRGGLINGDVILGGGDDLFDNRGGTINGTITGGSGADTVRGSAAADMLYGNDDADVLRGEGGADTLDGGEGQDYLYGGSGDDSLYGGGDGDTIYGNAGDDFIDGGGRHDMLVGGKGDDTLVGGGGADIFVFRRVGNGDDQVNDFQNGSDKIDLSDLGIQNFNALNNTFNAISADSDGVIIDLAAAGGSGSVRLLGIEKADLDGADFIF